MESTYSATIAPHDTMNASVPSPVAVSDSPFEIYENDAVSHSDWAVLLRQIRTKRLARNYRETNKFTDIAEVLAKWAKERAWVREAYVVPETDEAVLLVFTDREKDNGLARLTATGLALYCGSVFRLPMLACVTDMDPEVRPEYVFAYRRL